MMCDKKFRAGVFITGLFAALFSITGSAFVAESLKPFPNAELERSEQQLKKSHPVIVNRMKKVNGVVTSDDDRWLEGELIRKVFQLPQGQSSEAGYDFFVDQLSAQGVKKIFSCQSFSCGESNFWANDIFKIALLYGQNRQQYYYVGEKQGTYYSVYSIKRGNGRIYTLVDVFRGEEGEGRGDITLQNLTHRGFYDLYISEPLATSSELNRLEKLLKQNPELNLVLQVRGGIPKKLTDYDRQRKTLQTQGQQVLRTMADQGVASDRLRLETAASVPAAKELPADTLWLRVFPAH